MERLPQTFSERTVVDLLQKNVSNYTEKIAVVGLSSLIGVNRISYRELDRITNQLANAFVELGIRKGDKVSILLSNYNGLECFYTYHASHKIGAVNVPINIRYVGRELEYILNHSESRLLVLGEAYADKIAEIRNLLQNTKHFLIVGKDVPYWARSFYELIETGSGAPPIETINEDDIADIIYTSGTTGEPKGVVFTHGNCVAAGISISMAMTIGGNDIYQSATPFFTSTGCHSLPLSVLARGATYIIDPEFNVEKTLETMEREKTTLYLGVPSMFILLLDHPKIKEYHLSSLRILFYGGASMPKTVLERLYETFPEIGTSQMYGLTEAGPGGIFLPTQFAKVKIGSVGNQGIGLMKFRVVDDNDIDVRPNTTGELILRGPSVMKEYYKKPEETKEALRGGWLHTGDLVRMDEEGFLYHVDRKKDIIIRGGFNIASVEIEEVLFKHPAVFEAAVVAKPHKVLGEDVKAFIVLKAGGEATSQEIIDFCKTQLADFKVPREIEFIDALPKSPWGKVLKTVLREKKKGNQI
jgi:acyl-CoA synthetase (AMP-forming)/AMP-acid ligase II